VKKKSRHKGGKTGGDMAKSMVQIPLYRQRVVESAQDASRKRPSRNALMRAIDDGGRSNNLGQCRTTSTPGPLSPSLLK